MARSKVKRKKDRKMDWYPRDVFGECLYLGTIKIKEDTRHDEFYTLVGMPGTNKFAMQKISDRSVYKQVVDTEACECTCEHGARSGKLPHQFDPDGNPVQNLDLCRHTAAIMKLQLDGRI